jgi:hypothetical protein
VQPGQFTEREVPDKELEHFEFIQEILIEDCKVILKGFSKNSGLWMKYEFVGGNFVVEPIFDETGSS